MDVSSFDDNKHTFSLASGFSDLEPIPKNGATSDCYKVRIYGKWHFLKRPKEIYSSNPIYIAAFEKEFDLGFTLDHPNIVRYLNKGRDAGGNYILSEYIDGLSLTEFRKQNPEYFKQKANFLRFTHQLFSALSYLHARQIVHLDVKPDNILITRNGHDVKLIDLGMSYSDCYNEITGGSPAFGSPEQFSDPLSISFRSDMYAAGKVLLYIVTGETDVNSIGKVPQPFRTIAQRCLVKVVGKRTITADKCIELLYRRTKYNKVMLMTISIVLIGLLFYIYNFKTNIQPEILPQIKTKNIESETEESRTEESRTEENKIKDSVIEDKPSKKITTSPISAHPKQNNDSILLEKKLHQIIKARLSPNKLAMSKIYSTINEYNYEVLLQAFSNWKELCYDDCKQLYPTYKDSIRYVDFEKIYLKELSIMNEPVELIFKAFNDSAF
jgi:serine/threonine protein kinase